MTEDQKRARESQLWKIADQLRGKNTYPSLMGLDASVAAAQELASRAADLAVDVSVVLPQRLIDRLAAAAPENVPMI